MNILQITAALAACTAMSGCAIFGGQAISGQGAELLDSSPGVDVSRLDDPAGEADFQAAYQFIQGQDATTNMPNSGSATYLGGFGADATGDVNGFMTGALSMTVNNLNNGTVTGTADEFALYNGDGSLNRDFSGEVFLNGGVTGTAITAAGTDNIRDNSTGQESDATLTLNGAFRDVTRQGRASAATGTATGSGTGGFDFALSDGKFFLVGQD
ncbi:hypothetical protein [Maritimibacter sp. UBA3975]|uniref:hypothetical protein n=1 Tax=Maritimibacter sp. UBA3975 TaxID=1946833 RepID=UPI000C0ACB6D|nr:hypothetical protein [Maritimibacter sp. UBA3975]MAM60034.1 hypothetical protein [Maritimibacter sp.]